jgi:hypothetical protein
LHVFLFHLGCRFKAFNKLATLNALDEFDRIAVLVCAREGAVKVGVFNGRKIRGSMKGAARKSEEP